MPTLTQEDRKLIQTFNRNVEWLKKNHAAASVPNESEWPEWIGVEEALKILGRGRTYLKSRMIEDYVTASKPMNVNWFLIRGVDYERENGKILVFRSASVQRLKAEMRKAGAAEFVPDKED